MRFKPSTVIQLLLVLAIISVVAHAQAVKGSLLGTVSDPSGAAASGANITITETRTGISSSTTSNASGNYVFSSLQDGTYRIETSLKGFRKVVQEHVEVKVNTTVRVDVTLLVGEVSETVTVEAGQEPLLQTDRADTGRLLESKQVADLPLGFNRNFQGLMITVPGSTRPTRPHSQFFNSQDSLESKVNGQSRLANSVQIEGVDDNEKTGLLQVLIPAADAIDSVSISTSNYDAEFGRAGGAISSVTLKSGTNGIHGSAFFFGNNNNGWLQAGDYFTHGTAPTHYRQAGFTVGGPIKKNKLFYFADYQYTSDRQGFVFRHTVPYPEWFGGNFASSPTKIYDPATGNPDGTGRVQFLNNQIPTARISPVAKKLLAFLTPPNVPGAPLGTPNLVFNSVREKITHAFDVKVNYNITEKDVLSYRFSYQRPRVFDPGTYAIYGGPSNGGFAGAGTQNTISSAGNYTHTFTPSLILEARFGISWYHNVAISQGHGLKTSEEVGIKGANLDDFSSGLTSININGFGAPVLGFANSMPWDRGEKTYIGSGILTKLWGNHSLKFGEEVRHNRDLLLQIQDQGGVRGQYTFNGGRTAIPSDTAAQNGISNALAAFLLDVPANYSRDIKVIEQPGTKHYSFFTFAQDTWQVTPKLTLNLGIRHEYYTPLVGIVDKGGLSNYNPANNTELVAGYGNIPTDIGVEGTWKNFVARIGGAYRLTEKTVIRAGYGASVIPFPDNSYAFNFPVKQTEQFNAANAFAPIGAMAQGFAPVVLFPIPDSGIIDANLPILKNSALYSAPAGLREGTLHSFNVAVQRQLPFNFAVEAAYVGNVGRGILSTLNLNAANTLGTALPGNDNAARPLFPLYGRTTDVTTRVKTDTNFNSLQLKLDRRFTKGLLVTTNYTWSKALSNSGDDNGSIDTPADFTKNYGRAGFDRAHAFAGSFVWQIPFAQKLSGVSKWFLDGWQLSGIVTAYTGTPLDFNTSATNLHAPGNTQRPNMSSTPTVFGNYGPGQLYFDPTVFSTPAATLTGVNGVAYAPFGQLTRNSSIDGPGYWNVDASIFKSLPFTESIRGELRLDTFNTFNHPNPGNPNVTVTATTFGQITGMASSSRLVRFGFRVIF
jgi:hypothetical protein